MNKQVTLCLDFCGEGEFGQGFEELAGAQQEVAFYKENFAVTCTNPEDSEDEWGYSIVTTGTEAELKRLITHIYGVEALAEVIMTDA